MIQLCKCGAAIVQRIPHQKINRCLTDINRYLTDTENQFYKVLVVSVKYRLSIGLYPLYRLNIGQWCNLTLVRRFWATKVCLRASKISKIYVFGHPNWRITF